MTHPLDTTALELVEGMKARGLPCEVVAFDSAETGPVAVIVARGEAAKQLTAIAFRLAHQRADGQLGLGL